MQTAKWVFSAICAVIPATAAWSTEGSGLTANVDSPGWTSWQSRAGVRLVGDYYFTPSLIAANVAGGFHASSGLILNTRARSSAGQALLDSQSGSLGINRRIAVRSGAPFGNDANRDNATVPYLSVGYTGYSLKGGWNLSADLGFVAFAAGNAVKFGRVFSGTQTLDDMVRDMRLAPVMQLGVSYSY